MVSRLKILCLVLDPKGFPTVFFPKVFHLGARFVSRWLVRGAGGWFDPVPAGPRVTPRVPADLYVSAVLLCCLGILSVLLFTLTVAWQSVLRRRKPRGEGRRPRLDRGCGTAGGTRASLG